MNFKPTLWKSVVSILAGIFVDYYQASHVIYKLMLVYPSTSELMLRAWPIALSVALIIYIIWSLFQKK